MGPEGGKAMKLPKWIHVSLVSTPNYDQLTGNFQSTLGLQERSDPRCSVQTAVLAVLVAKQSLVQPLSIHFPRAWYELHTSTPAGMDEGGTH